MPLPLLLSLLLWGCGQLEEVFIEEDLLQRPEAKRCADCHASIYEEWKKSRHYNAWTSESFRVETENYAKLKCLSCHAPHQVDPEKKPALRVEFRKDGVSCVACHFKEETGAMHGPLKVWSPPHPSQKDLAYKNSNLCAGCHRETYKEWKATKTKTTCQNCHMPSVGKKDLIQKFPFYLFHRAKPRTSHEFPALRAKSEDVEVKLSGNRLILTNVGVPHNLPTADQGNPKLYLVARVYYEGGGVRTVRRIFSPASKTALPYRVPISVRLPPGDIKLVEVKLLRKLAWSDKRDTIAELTLKAPSP
ncbi:MAG TPA: hypothetical protein EYP11_06025 [Aquificaceae bacterium]|nr:hypothetical protein [Aquificaceae bacterium]